jgi:hypothetical protein
MILLSCLIIVAMGSLVFQLDYGSGANAPFFYMWECLVLAAAIISLLAAAITMVQELRANIIRHYLLNYYGKRSHGQSIQELSSSMRVVAPGKRRKSGMVGGHLTGNTSGNFGQDSKPFGVMDMFVASSLISMVWNRRPEETQEIIKLLLDFDLRFARQLRLDDLSSYLSTSHRARFFRGLARTFPSLLDTLCSTDVTLKEQIANLQRSICFMCDCIAQCEAKRGRPFHAFFHDWQLGPIFELLVAGASMFVRLVEVYVACTTMTTWWSRVLHVVCASRVGTVHRMLVPLVAHVGGIR